MDCIERNGVDRVFHLGGMLSLPSENNPWGAFDANVVGTYNILEAARIKKMRQVVYGSTIATYSRDIPGETIDDRTIQRPSSLYGVTKTFGELAGGWYQRRFGVTLDPAAEVLSLIGSKEGIGHIPLAFVDPGDTVLVPSPGYPVYPVGVLFAGGESHIMPLKEENGYRARYPFH